MPPDDDFLDPLDQQAAALEARFRALEDEAELASLRRRAGAADPASPAPETADGEDPLARMKAALDQELPLDRHLLVVCPACGGRNRVPLARLRLAEPLCGRCKEPLAAGD